MGRLINNEYNSQLQPYLQHKYDNSKLIHAFSVLSNSLFYNTELQQDNIILIIWLQSCSVSLLFQKSWDVFVT